MKERKIDAFRPMISLVLFTLLCGLFLFSKFYLFLVALIICYIFFPSVRYCFGSIDLLTSSLVVNTVNYFRYKEYNSPDSYIGTIDCFVADSQKVFGCCKTLSAVRNARHIYKKYNEKSYYDYKSRDPHWITWKVQVISNVDIEGVPVIPFCSLNQLVELNDIDTDGLLTVVVMDECNAIMNSRNFKTNFQNEEQIKSIVTCQHNNIYMMLVGQRFEYLDKLIRSLSDRVIMCSHYPIFNTLRHRIYDACELDKVVNPSLIKCRSVKWFYLFPSDYNAYDTKALVSLVAHEKSISSTELISRKGDNSSDLVGGRTLSAKGKKLRKKGLS